MKYIIDSASLEEIQEALELGAYGVTANPSMYLKNRQEFLPFLRTCSTMNLSFLSGEVMGDTLEEMEDEAQRIHNINPDIIIKLNFSGNALKMCRRLRKRGIRTALTLIFTVAQAAAAISAGADYLFPFIGRSDEYGQDGLKLVQDIQTMIDRHGYPVFVVAASIKNIHQLEAAAAAGVPYAAIPCALYLKALEHPLTRQGTQDFERDWKEVHTFFTKNQHSPLVGSVCMLSLFMMGEIGLESGDFWICVDFWMISYVIFRFSFVIRIVIKGKFPWHSLDKEIFSF